MSNKQTVWAVIGSDSNSEDPYWTAWSSLFQSEDAALEQFRREIRDNEEGLNADAYYPEKYSGRLAVIADRVVIRIEKQEVSA